MSAAAVEAFERIAISQPPLCRKTTLDGLLARGLIVRGPDVIRKDAFGEYAVPTYEVPLPVHYQWCTWAGEQLGEGEIG